MNRRFPDRGFLTRSSPTLLTHSPDKPWRSVESSLLRLTEPRSATAQRFIAPMRVVKFRVAKAYVDKLTGATRAVSDGGEYVVDFLPKPKLDL